MTRHFALTAIALVCLSYFEDPVYAQRRSTQQQLAVDIYRELVEINTVTATGDTCLYRKLKTADRGRESADTRCRCQSGCGFSSSAIISIGC